MPPSEAARGWRRCKAHPRPVSTRRPALSRYAKRSSHCSAGSGRSAGLLAAVSASATDALDTAPSARIQQSGSRRGCRAEQDAPRRRRDARPNTKAGLALVVMCRAERGCFTPGAAARTLRRTLLLAHGCSSPPTWARSLGGWSAGGIGISSKAANGRASFRTKAGPADRRSRRRTADSAAGPASGGE